VDQQQEERKMAPRRIGLSGVEVVSPELRQALGIKKPTNLLDPAQTAQRPGGLGAIFFPESKIQSAQARAMLGSGITGEGVSPGIQQALTGSPIGAPSQADLIDVLNERQDPIKRSAEIVDDFRELNDAQVINNALRGLESDIDPKAKTAQQTTDKSTSETSEVIDTSFDSDADADKPRDENLTAAQKATKTALDQFINEARPGVSPQNYDDYIKEFGEATGLDISGDPDTKQALMSFGLALMQNRAGKGFNLSNILGSVGEAGEAALPEFSKAVSEAKAIRAKAGAFAISRKKEDEAEARSRKNYVIVPKGTGGIKGLAANMDKARNIPLNSFELNALIENENFSKQFEIVPDSQYDKVLTAALKTPELGKKYMASKGTLPLFEGAEGLFDVPVQYPDRNYKGTDAANKPAFLGDTKAVEEAFRSMRKDIDRGKAQFKELVDTINQEGVTVFDQSADAVTNLGAAFGIKFRDDQTPTKKIELILNRIQSKYAPEILGETGKTISDADRQRVAKIVGELKFFQNPDDLKAAIERIFGDIIGTQERKLKQGLTTFNRLTNRQVSLNFGGGLTEKQQEELAAYEAKFNPKGT